MMYDDEKLNSSVSFFFAFPKAFFNHKLGYEHDGLRREDEGGGKDSITLNFAIS